MDDFFQYTAVTDDIKVMIGVNFHEERSDIEHGRWFWIYHVRIVNQGLVPVRLMLRHWVIKDGLGATSHVSGEGVIGKQPWIAPGQHYDYVSGCPLSTHKGSMEGHYDMVTQDEDVLLVRIPKFNLYGPMPR